MKSTKTIALIITVFSLTAFSKIAFAIGGNPSYGKGGRNMSMGPKWVAMLCIIAIVSLIIAGIVWIAVSEKKLKT